MATTAVCVRSHNCECEIVDARRYPPNHDNHTPRYSKWPAWLRSTSPPPDVNRPVRARDPVGYSRTYSAGVGRPQADGPCPPSTTDPELLARMRALSLLTELDRGMPVECSPLAELNPASVSGDNLIGLASHGPSTRSPLSVSRPKRCSHPRWPQAPTR